MDCLKKFVCFEICALFHSPVQRVKSAPISKQTNFFRQSSRSYIVSTLNPKLSDLSRSLVNFAKKANISVLSTGKGKKGSHEAISLDIVSQIFLPTYTIHKTWPDEYEGFFNN